MVDEAESIDARTPHAPVIDLEAETITEAGEASAPLPPKKSRARLWGAAALVIAAAITGSWLYRSYGANFWPTDAMVELGTRVGVIETGARTLDAQIKGLGAAVDGLKADSANSAAAASDAAGTASTARSSADAATAAVAALTGRLEQAESTLVTAQSAITALQTAIATGGPVTVAPADSAQIDALAMRVAELEKAVATLQSTRTAGPDAATAALLSQTLADLKARLAAGAPYTDELARLRQLVPAAPGLDELSPSAASGLATAAMLAQQLARLRDTLPGPEPIAAPAGDSAWDWFAGLLGGIVTVRDLGATDWRDVAARALAFAEAGDLAQAVAAIAAAEGETPPALSAWAAAARARLAGDAAAESVSAAVLRQIAALGAAP